MDDNHSQIFPIAIYTDGACRGNPGKGGWGALLISRDRWKEIYGGEVETTNNRMELKAAVEALNCLTRSCSIDLYTDSKYVKDGILKWIGGWKKNNWRTTTKKPVKNRDLWEELDQARSRHQINWHWVKGHTGNEGNERADKLANQAIDEISVKK